MFQFALTFKYRCKFMHLQVLLSEVCHRVCVCSAYPATWHLQAEKLFLLIIATVAGRADHPFTKNRVAMFHLRADAPQCKA